MHHQSCPLLLVTYCRQELDSSECFHHTPLESFVFFVYLPELLLSLVFYYIAHVDVGGLEKDTGTLRVGIISHFDLLALQLGLLWSSILWLLFLLWGYYGSWAFILFTEPLILFPPHLFEQILLVSLIFGLLDSV